MKRKIWRGIRELGTWIISDYQTFNKLGTLNFSLQSKKRGGGHVGGGGAFKTFYLIFINNFVSGGHSLDRPISNPSLTDKMINEELETMFDLNLSDKRKWYF